MILIWANWVIFLFNRFSTFVADGETTRGSFRMLARLEPSRFDKRIIDIWHFLGVLNTKPRHEQDQYLVLFQQIKIAWLYSSCDPIEMELLSWEQFVKNKATTESNACGCQTLSGHSVVPTSNALYWPIGSNSSRVQLHPIYSLLQNPMVLLLLQSCALFVNYTRLPSYFGDPFSKVSYIIRIITA